MLLLSRKQGEKVVIGKHVEVTVSRISGNRVTLAIKAPEDVCIRRSELPEDPDIQAKRLTQPNEQG